MRLTLAAKRVGDKWEGALVVDNKFQRALVADKLDEVLLRGLAGTLAVNRPEGTDVVLELVVETPGEPAPAQG